MEMNSHLLNDSDNHQWIDRLNNIDSCDAAKEHNGNRSSSTSTVMEFDDNKVADTVDGKIAAMDVIMMIKAPDELLEPEQSEQDSSDNNNPMSQNEFVEFLKESFFQLKDLSQMIKWIEKTTYYLKNYTGLCYYYDKLVKIYFVLLKNSIHDPFYKIIHIHLDKFFLEFQKKYLECEIVEESSSEHIHGPIWTDLIDEMFEDKLYETLISANEDNIFISTTVPLALNTLVVINLTFCPFRQTLSLFQKILLILHDRCQRQQLPSSIIDVPDEPWSQLAANVHLCIRIYSAIDCVQNFNDKQIQQLTLLLVDLGIGGGGNDDDQDYRFRKLLIRKAIKDLACTLVMPQINLFLFFQKEIGQLLIEKLNQDFRLKLLYDCMDYFSIKSLPNELLCWIIPDFVVKCSTQTRLLLDQVIEVQKLMQKPKISLIKQYFKDIMIHLFYETSGQQQQDDYDHHVKMLYQIITFLTDYCQQNVFQLVHDLNKPLTDAFLQRISKDRQITMKALSFMVQSVKIEDQFDQILNLNLDMFEKNEEKFRNFLHQKFFIYHIHKIDRYLVRNDFRITEKLTIIQSFEIILRYLSDQYINRYRVRIYFIIRLLLSERINSNVIQMFEIGLKILDFFIVNVERDFLESEMLSICLLIVPLVKRLPKESSQLLLKLLSLHQYRTSLYYQLCFLPSESSPLKPVVELIQQRLNQFVSETTTTNSSALNITMNSRSSSSATASSCVDTNNNERIGIDDSFRNIMSVNQDLNQMIYYLKSMDFSLKCREIYFLLESLDYSSNEKLQEVLLRQLYSRLDSNKELFYRIYFQRSPEFSDLDSFLSNLYIDLKIDNETRMEPQQSLSDKTATISANTEIIEITLSQFFRRIILKLFQCLKFSTSTEIQKLVTNCLGVLGAIQVDFLNFSYPFQRDFHHQNVDIILLHSIDYSNYQLFQPKKKLFKLLVLDVLMQMVKSSARLTDYNCASFALQETLPFFSETLNHCSSLLEPANVDFDTLGPGSGATQQIEHYVRNQFQNKSYSAQQQQVSAKISPSQEMEQLNKCDQIKQFLQNEKNEFLDLDQDLHGELRYYRQVLDYSMFSAKDLKKRDTCVMDTFFETIKPTMSYGDFLKSFIHMLYHSFIIPHLKKLENSTGDFEVTSGKTFVNYEEIFTQNLSSNVSQSHKSNSGSTLMKEFDEIKAKIGRLQTPEKIFLVCYHCIFRNLKLSYVLVPCLMLMSLGHGTDEQREKFAENFKTMIEEKFLQQRMMFIYELGQMGSELLFYLYDFLHRWYRSRRLAHSVLISSRFFRERTVRTVDHEFHAIKLILDRIDPILMARLACEARNYCKALHYLEHYYNDDLQTILNVDHVHSLSVNVEHSNNFICKHSKLYLKIYHGLQDLDSLNGLSFAQRQQKTEPFSILIDNLFYRHLLDQDSVGQLICGSKLISMQMMTNKNSEPNDIPTSVNNKIFLYDVQEKYFQTLVNLDQHLPSWTYFLKDQCSPNLYHHMLESTWKLNSWDLVGMDVQSLLLNFSPNFSDYLNFPWSTDLPDHQPSSSHNHCSYTPSFGYILSAMYKKESPFILDTKISDVRQSFMAPLNSALLSNSATAYFRSYQTSLVPIHIMYDIQQFVSTIYNRLLMIDSDSNLSDNQPTNSSSTTNQMKTLFKELIDGWRLRNTLLPDGPVRQQVLDVQRSLIHLLQYHKSSLNLNEQLFRYWHESIRCSLQAGSLDRAYISLMEAIRINTINKSITDSEQVEFLLDEAQVFWIRNNQTISIELLRSELEQRYEDIQKHCYLETLKNFSQMPEQDLYNLSNTLSLKLTRSQFQQISANSSMSFVGAPRATSSPNTNHDDTSFIDSIEQEKLHNYGRLQLRYAQYCEHAGLLNSYALIILYKSVTISCPRWEEAHFQLAMFYRRLYRQYQNSGHMLASKTTYNLGKPDEIIDLKARVIKSLCESLKFGSYKFVRLSLPTLLNIWIDLGYECMAYQKKFRFNEQNQMVKVMKDLSRRITERSTLLVRQMFLAVNNAIFLIELDTLIGHLLHPFEPISELIGEILISLIADFPHHMSWQFSRSLNTHGRRGQKSKELVKSANKLIESSRKQQHSTYSTSYIVDYFENFRQFSQCLNELAQYKPPKNHHQPGQSISDKNDIYLRRVAPNLFRTLQSEYKFILPCNKFFMPNSMNLERWSGKANFFKSLFIEKVQDHALVMKSLQMPKKLTFICHNGLKRTVLVKCGDDLRRDRTMLNFCNTFNQCYRGEIPVMQNIEPLSNIDSRFDMSAELRIWSQRRQQPLLVQTYFVVPLSDNCGVIEWIPGLCSLKTLVEGQYTRTRARAKKFLSAKTSFIKSVIASSLTREKRIERFRQSFPNFQPPVFQNWFHENYSDSFSWYVARRNFTRTSAVFSMLGYILGLCDRHSENILLDPTTGQMVQVDFNCLFNRGEEFMVPECVPFRLTHNMIAAMGTLGYEGLFRATCEDVLLVARQFRELFSQHITIFLYDIFVDWLESSDRTGIAEKSVFNVEARLFGITSRTNRKLPKGNIMSISGQVDHVVKEATDFNNLGAMYHGWASFI